MSSLRKLGLCYLVSASVFVLAATLAAHPDLHLRVRAENLARDFQALVLAPAARLVRAQDLVLFDAPYVSARVAIDMGPRVEIALAPPPAFAAPVQSLILPDLSPLPAPALPGIAAPDAPRAALPHYSLAQSQPSGEIAAAAQMAEQRLKDNLTPEMLRNFGLFLYVSKAPKGPVAQRMYVFTKTAAGELSLLYDWPASTGREKREVTTTGRHTVTDTPQGFYQLDPGRMYRRYHSTSWDQAMPFAMFFNWEHQGLQTGLAIHAATGDDIARLGTRASAGCVHLSPENAQTLYNLIRANYKGPVPRFAYDRATATLSKNGDFARDADGGLRMAQGYQVLIQIEDYAGADVVAALF